MNPRAINVEYNSPYKLIITFTDEKVKILDLQPYIILFINHYKMKYFVVKLQYNMGQLLG